MVETCKEMVEVTEELKKVCFNLMTDDGMYVFKNMRPEELKMMQLCLKAVDISNNIIMEQAKLLDDLDKKINTLLNRKGFKES